MGTAPAQAASASAASGTSSSTSAMAMPFCGPTLPATQHPVDKLALIGALREGVADQDTSVDSLLAAVADAARILAGANGIAVALLQNEKIVCRARSGNIGPELGAPLSAHSGISGACLRGANILFCHDALSDERVDAEVCRNMGIRSIVAVPLRGATGIVGILEAFATHPNAFDGDALKSLRALSEICESAYARERGENWPRPTRTQFLKTATRVPQTISNPASKDEASKDSRGRFWIAAGIAMALSLTFFVAWWSWHQPGDEAEPSVHAAQTDNPGTTPAAEMPHPPATPKPDPGIPAHSYPNPHFDRLRPGRLLRNAADIRPEPGNSPSSQTGLPVLPATVLPAPSMNVVDHFAESKRASVESESPPVIDLSIGATSNHFSQAIAESAALPTLDPRIAKGVTEPTLIRKVDPAYPSQARARRLSGKVTVNARIGEDGSVRDVALISGLPELAEAAEAAVRRWRYRPALLNGKPVEIEKQITFAFTLPQ